MHGESAPWREGTVRAGIEMRIPKGQADEIITCVREVVTEHLSEWL